MNEGRRERVIQNARKWKRATNYNEKRRLHARELRLSVLKYYSSETPNCACCGTEIYEFLVLDHKDGGGNQHRRKVWGRNRGGGNDTIYWIIKNDFPPLFQVLCHNCNNAKAFHSVCPHQK